MKKFRAGDRVSLEGTVVGGHAGVAYIVDVVESHHGGHASLMMKEGQLTLVKREIRVGDEVREGFSADRSTVIAVDGGTAWIRDRDGYQRLASINDLELEED